MVGITSEFGLSHSTLSELSVIQAKVFSPHSDGYLHITGDDGGSINIGQVRLMTHPETAKEHSPSKFIMHLHLLTYYSNDRDIIVKHYEESKLL